MEAEAQLYCALMTDAKQRVGLIRQLDAGEFSTSRTEFDLELACLSLRRVLELIAFSSLPRTRTPTPSITRILAIIGRPSVS